MIYSEITAFGTPEGIRIPDLPLRRRTLYPAELLGHMSVQYCNGLSGVCQDTGRRRVFENCRFVNDVLHIRERKKNVLG